MVYLLIVYDVSVERVNKVHKYLKTYLHWQQNSVFEGEVSSSQYQRMMSELFDLIDPDVDSVMIYEFPEKYLQKTILGIEKNPIDFIL
ncbi:CRISPR-associated endonuclease Cas2 [uncultured Methanobrevibacter sp.]|uniref:CRISPR-associated endonuclease Cas2 n=1 Tax=uncultured Methanobrevibacter sp. TaxID=253161 RepID=UPI0025EF56A5|nr:CRISPR-associated endonuclease Cas2 [uncultured Methanobrevibacter sp.]